MTIPSAYSSWWVAQYLGEDPAHPIDPKDFPPEVIEIIHETDGSSYAFTTGNEMIFSVSEFKLIFEIDIPENVNQL